MTARWIRCAAAICVCGVLAAWARTAEGQRREPTGEGARAARVLKLEKFEAVGQRNLVKTPEYRSNVNRGAAVSKEWSQIMARYTTYPEWIDALTFQYWVMALIREDGKNAYSLYKKTVRYVDIEAGRDHASTVFLHPNAIKRYGPVVAAAVEISFEGRVVEEATQAEIPVPERWWRNPQVVESDAVTAREGYLLNRSESPWALINADDYELIR